MAMRAYLWDFRYARASFVCFLFIFGNATARAAAATVEAARAQAAQFISQGRYEEALGVAGPWIDELRRQVVRNIESANQQGDEQAALQLYEAFFDKLGVGYLDWHIEGATWEKLALDYVALREKFAPFKTKAMQQDADAQSAYRQLTAVRTTGDLDRCRLLADAIVAKHPNSLFCPAAILSVGYLASQSTISFDRTSFYRQCADRMQASAAPLRSLMLVRFAQANSLSNSRDLVARGRAVSVYLEIGRQTDSAFERRTSLLLAGEAALRAELRDQGRALCREFLTKHPDDLASARVRQQIAQSYVSSNDPDSALEAVREMEQVLGGAVDLSPELFAVSQAFFKAAKYDKSLELLMEIAQRYPEGRGRSLAQIGMGEVYQKLGDEPSMLAAYKAAILLKRTPTSAHIMDASDTHNRAAQFLGRYYLDKQDWAASLTYWQAWRPQSWCGTCTVQMHQSRRWNMINCLLKLGRHKDAAQLALEAIFVGEGSSSSEPATTLIRLYDQADQRADLRRIIDLHNEQQLKSMRRYEYAKKLSDETLLSHLATYQAWERLRIDELASKKDVEGLIGICLQFKGPAILSPAQESNWRYRAAAEALARCDAAALGPIQRVLRDKKAPKDWLVYALGKSPSPRALSILKRLTEQVAFQNENLAHAISMQGEPGRQLLQQLAKGKQSQVAQHAQRWLDQPVTPEPPQLEWDPPPQGSLPKIYEPNKSIDTASPGH